jgi:hypothetical protein
MAIAIDWGAVLAGALQGGADEDVSQQHRTMENDAKLSLAQQMSDIQEARDMRVMEAQGRQQMDLKRFDYSPEMTQAYLDRAAGEAGIQSSARVSEHEQMADADQARWVKMAQSPELLAEYRKYLQATDLGAGLRQAQIEEIRTNIAHQAMVATATKQLQDAVASGDTDQINAATQNYAAVTGSLGQQRAAGYQAYVAAAQKTTQARIALANSGLDPVGRAAAQSDLDDAQSMEKGLAQQLGIKPAAPPIMPMTKDGARMVLMHADDPIEMGRAAQHFGPDPVGQARKLMGMPAPGAAATPTAPPGLGANPYPAAPAPAAPLQQAQPPTDPYAATGIAPPGVLGSAMPNPALIPAGGRPF